MTPVHQSLANLAGSDGGNTAFQYRPVVGISFIGEGGLPCEECDFKWGLADGWRRSMIYSHHGVPFFEAEAR